MFLALKRGGEEPLKTPTRLLSYCSLSVLRRARLFFFSNLSSFMNGVKKKGVSRGVFLRKDTTESLYQQAPFSINY